MKPVNFYVTPVMLAHCKYCTTTIFVFSVLPIETCMFPKFLSLPTDQDLNRYLHLFLSPKLRRCALPAIHPEVKSVATRCAALEDLSIKSSFKITAADRQALYDSIHLCKGLVTLACPPLDCTTWGHLSDLPGLLTLEIWGDRCWLGGRYINFAPFLNVTRLYFLTRTAAYTVAVMQHLEFPSLNQFDMDVHDLPWAEAEPLFHALSRCKTLSHIHIAIFSDCDDREVQDLLGSSLTPISINLDNDLLLEAMSSWPHIRMLELMDPQEVPTITFRGLFAALRRCPPCICWTYHAVNIDIDPTAESFQHTSLQHLNLTSSGITGAEAVAHIIVSVLPSVDRVILPANQRSERPSDVCLEVQRHLESFRASAIIGRHITRAASKT
ncbi:hypothetical protein EDB19DRAFT_1190052 [Suillus lakei]|nr:hypothetical protein EDB19DRAFT_1190052 [Suillus lakei]